jgi:hypothetical protein
VHGDKCQKERNIRREGKTEDSGRMPDHCLPTPRLSQVSRLNGTRPPAWLRRQRALAPGNRCDPVGSDYARSDPSDRQMQN